MRFSFLTRKWHKWLSLIVGVQALFWLISGVYMVTVNLDYIHGDQLVRNMDEPLEADFRSLLPYATLQHEFPNATKIQLISWLGMPHYRIYTDQEAHLVDANSGKLRSPLAEEDARRVASYHFAQEGNIVNATLLSDPSQAPSEIQSRPLPLWQITFDDVLATALYVSPNDGRLVTRRHTFWRVFDFVWMFHIMDYEDRSDVNNNLLRFAAFLGVILSISGLWLIFYSFNKRKNDKTEGEQS